jgi:hypothetical protein
MNYRKKTVVKLSLKKYAPPKNYSWVIIIEKLLLLMIYTCKKLLKKIIAHYLHRKYAPPKKLRLGNYRR